MNDLEIDSLKTRVAQGGVFWKNDDRVCSPVSGVNLNWVEFPDEDDPIAEPVAVLATGGVVALYNTDASSFVTLQAAL